MTTQTADRILDAMAIYRLNLSKETLANIDPDLDIDFHEHSAYHIAKSIAQANDTITVDEAWTVSRCLGNVWNPENGGWARYADTAAKIVVLKLMGRLLAVDDPRKDPVDAIPVP